MTNLSQWFDLAEQKPWKVGVYQVEGVLWPSEDCWSYFDGKGFNYKSYTSAGHAFSMRERVGSGHRVKKWRGLSTNPEVKKREKIMNKQKTMYAVIPYDKDEEYRPVAVFENKEVAEKRAEYLSKNQKGCFNSIKYMVHAIRFRTPE